MRKWRLRPDSETARVLRGWMGAVRFTYNWALGHLLRKRRGLRYNVFELRKLFVNAKSIPPAKKFLLDTPKHVRDGALEDLVAGFKLNMQKRKKDPSHRFRMSFRSRKQGDSSVVIPKASLKLLHEGRCDSLRMYPQYLKTALRVRTRLGKNDDGTRSVPAHDCRLVMDRLGRFYLHVPVETPANGAAAARDKQAGGKAERHWASIDPGVRTFATVYSPTTGTLDKLADGDAVRLYRLCKSLDDLVSLTCRQKCRKTRKRMQRAQWRLRYRIRHLVDEVHWKCARWLVTRFAHIVIPPFASSNMVKRGSRRIRCKTVRQLLTWSHYRFRQRLLAVAASSGSRVHVMGEEYTTKACSCCGRLNHAVGGSKIFKCPHCGLRSDRDGAGARNIFLKNVAISAGGP